MPQGSLPHVTCSDQCPASVKCHPGSGCCHLPAACPSEFVEPSSPSQRPREAHCTGVHAGAQRGRAARSGTPAQGGVDTGRQAAGQLLVRLLLCPWTWTTGPRLPLRWMGKGRTAVTPS